MKNIIFIIVFLSCVFYGKAQVFVTESEAVTVTSKYMQHYMDDTSFQAKEVSRVEVLKKEGHVLLLRGVAAGTDYGMGGVRLREHPRQCGAPAAGLHKSGDSGSKYFLPRTI